MNADTRTAPTQAPAQCAAGRLEQMLAGVATTHSIYAVAKLGIADLLAGGPRTTEEPASLAAVDSLSLYRLLRALASVGVFAEIAPATFALTSIAERLKTDAPDSLRAWAIFTGEIAVPCWGGLIHSLRTGHPAFESVFGRSVFEYLEAHPDTAAVFDHHQAQGGLALHAAVAAAYDFGAIGTIIDVGGGNGSLVAAILKRHPGVRATTFDLPHVIERARAAAHPTLNSRCNYIGGSFFDTIPPRRRRLPALPRAARLGRRPRRHHPHQLPPGHARRRAAARHRADRPPRQPAPRKQVHGPQHAHNHRRPRTNRTPIPRPVRTVRPPARPDHPHPIRGERARGHP
jgi:O-methyltransferase domain